jgi:hypothetical protein
VAAGKHIEAGTAEMPYRRRFKKGWLGDQGPRVVLTKLLPRFIAARSTTSIRRVCS